MAREKKIQRKSGLSQREEKRIEDKKKKEESGLANKISKVFIMIVLVAMVISLIYSIVLFM